MKNIVELTEESFESAVLESKSAVLVDFYAPWCGPCKMLAPVLEKLAAEFDGRVTFAKVNVDHAPELAARFQVTGVPTLALFRAGQFVGRTVGMASPRQLQEWLQGAIAETAA